MENRSDSIRLCGFSIMSMTKPCSKICLLVDNFGRNFSAETFDVTILLEYWRERFVTDDVRQSWPSKFK